MSFSDRLGITKPRSVLQVEEIDDALRRIVFERDGIVVRVNLAVPDCALVEIVERA